MKKDSTTIHKALFKITVILSLVSFVLLIFNFIFLFDIDKIYSPPPLTIKIFLIVAIVFGVLSIVLYISTPRPKTTCVSHKLSFTNFEEMKSHLQNSLLTMNFKVCEHFRTQFGYEVFVFKKGIIKKEYFFIVKISHYLGIDSLKDIPVTLIRKFAFNISLEILKNMVVLCFDEKSELWYSDFLNIPDPSNNQHRFFWTAADLNDGQFHFFEYRENIPYTYYKKMNDSFFKIMGTDSIENDSKPLKK